MCSVCSENGRLELCAACRERTGTGSFPLRRDGWTFSALMRHSYETYRSNLTTITLASLIVFAIIASLHVLGGLITLAFPDQMLVGAAVSLLLLIPQVIAQGALTLGMCAISIAAARGEKPDVSMLFGQLSRVGAWLAQSAVTYLVMLPAALLVGIPIGIMAVMGSDTGMLVAAVVGGVPAFIAMLYVLLGLIFGSVELVLDAKIGALAALKSSWRIAAGQRWSILGSGIVALGLMLAGAIACGIGFLFAAGFCSVMFASLFLALKNGAPEPTR